MKAIIPVVFTFSVLLLIPLGFQSVFAGSPPIGQPAPYGPDNPPGPPIPVIPFGPGDYDFANLIIFDPNGPQQEKHFLEPLPPGQINQIREQVVNAGQIPITDWHELIVDAQPARWVGPTQVLDCTTGGPLPNAIITEDPQEIWIDFIPPIQPGECFEVQKAFEFTNLESFLRVIEYPTAQQLDFGDLPDAPHPTLLASDGARHLILPGVFMGGIVDGEPDGQPDPAALGDDLFDASDDEDGVFPATLTSGTMGNIVTVFNSVAGDIHIFIAQPPVAGGALVSVGSASPAVPGPTPVSIDLTGFGAGAADMRVRFCTTGDCGVPRGASMSGEVEDYVVDIEEGLDWGDLDDPPYPTLSASGGPSHLITGLTMGSFVDAESDGQPNPTADRDDIVGVPDDEDGLTMTSLVAGDASSTITIGSTSGPGTIHVFADKGAGLVPVGMSAVGAGGPHIVPADMTGASAGPIELRVRFCDTADCSTIGGFSASGEVEDYIETVTMAPPMECPPGTTGVPPNCVPIPPNPVGGTGIPISTTSLLVAGLSTNYSILMALAVIGLGAFGALYYSTKKKSEEISD